MAKKSTVKPSAAPVKPALAANAPITPGKNALEQWLPWVLAGLALLLYATGVSNGMVAMDDHSATVNNPAVKDFALFGQFNLGMYAPVTWAAYGLAYSIGKDNAFWYHLLSALVHAANVLLVFRLFRYLSPNWHFAGIVALFFAIHPIQVEAVSWIAGFSTPLFSLFYLAALLCYLQYRSESGQTTGRLGLALGLFVLACLSKSAAVTLPLTMLVLDLWLSRTLSAKMLTEKIPFFAVSLFFGVLTLYSRAAAGHTGADALVQYTFFDRFLMVCHTIPFYWLKILAPTGLSIWYPFEKMDGNWPVSYFAAPLVLAGVCWAAWRWRNQAKVVGLGLLFYLSNILLSLPYATFGTFELRSDRYNYLACLGVFALLAALPSALAAKKGSWANAAWGLLFLLSLFYGYQTVHRIRDWKDTLTLINKAIAEQGDNFGKAYLWRGMEYGDAGKRQPAIEDFTRAIDKNPGLIDAYKYRGGLLGMTGQHEKALADLNIYLDQNPNDPEYLFNRGVALRKLGKYPEAIADFSKTLQLQPTFAPAYRARGNAYSEMGETAKAQADLEMYGRLKK